MLASNSSGRNVSTKEVVAQLSPLLVLPTMHFYSVVYNNAMNPVLNYTETISKLYMSRDKRFATMWFV